MEDGEGKPCVLSVLNVCGTSVMSPIECILQHVRDLPRQHPFRTVFRAVKHSPRLFSDGLLKDYLLYRFRKPLTIVVLGMHRSGTSFVTRAINLLGARLGDDLLGATTSNPAGHWEHAYSLDINRRLLEMAGGRWDDPPDSVEAGPVSKLRMRLFLTRLHEKGKNTAVWKDPRTPLTFQVWKKEIENYVPVFVFRHPSSVSSSLQRRNGFTEEKSISLWQEYNTRLISIDECEEESYFINFDGGISHIRKKINKISKSEGLEFSEDAIDFYSQDLRSSDSLALADGETGDIYRELQSRAE